MSQASAATPLTALDLDNIHAFPKLLAVGADDRYHGRHSYKIVEALAKHHASTQAIEAELANLQTSDKSFKGHSSAEIASAIAKYAAGGHKELPQSFRTGTNAIDSTAMASNASASSKVTLAVSGTAPVYSWAGTLHAMNWARVLYTIVWIVTGLMLLFFGYASLFWLHKLGLSAASNRRHSVAAGLAGTSMLSGRSGKRRSAAASRPRRPRAYMAGGVGGVLIGFLFCSYLAVVINNAVCANDDGKKPLAAAAYFAVWLAPGLLGAVIGGHFVWIARAMAGVLGATALTVMLTAMFGIRTLLVRVVLISILTTVMTLPLVQPRAKTIQMLLLNACTSFIGMVTFLNGVALVAPSHNASANWLDLWTLLFMKDSAASSKDPLIDAWGSGMFKGYVAGAVLGSAVGFALELVMHRRSGMDPENEWNQYLGAYTHHIESGQTDAAPAAYDAHDPTAAAALAGRSARASVLAAAAHSRAGMFEPPASAWQRMMDFFDGDASRPAHYGGLSGDGTDGHLKASPLSDKIRRKRSSKHAANGNDGSGPARFSALPKGDFDDESSGESDDEDEFDEKHAGPSDDEATELGSDDEKTKRSSIRKVRETLPALRKEPPSATYNYGGYALPRPPLQQHNSSSVHSDAGTAEKSRLTGTTLHGSSSSGSVGHSLHKPVNVYRDSLTQPPSRTPQATAAAATAAVPATPSLINAITRIEQAQRQARAWQQQHDTRASPYAAANDDNATPASPPAPSRKNAHNKSP